MLDLQLELTNLSASHARTSMLYIMFMCPRLLWEDQKHQPATSLTSNISRSQMKFACLMQQPKNSILGAFWLSPSSNLSLPP